MAPPMGQTAAGAAHALGAAAGPPGTLALEDVAAMAAQRLGVRGDGALRALDDAALVDVCTAALALAGLDEPAAYFLAPRASGVAVAARHDRAQAVRDALGALARERGLRIEPGSSAPSAHAIDALLAACAAWQRQLGELDEHGLAAAAWRDAGDVVECTLRVGRDYLCPVRGATIVYCDAWCVDARAVDSAGRSAPLQRIGDLLAQPGAWRWLGYALARSAHAPLGQFEVVLRAGALVGFPRGRGCDVAAA